MLSGRQQHGLPGIIFIEQILLLEKNASDRPVHRFLDLGKLQRALFIEFLEIDLHRQHIARTGQIDLIGVRSFLDPFRAAVLSLQKPQKECLFVLGDQLQFVACLFPVQHQLQYELRRFDALLNLLRRAHQTDQSNALPVVNHPFAVAQLNPLGNIHIGVRGNVPALDGLPLAEDLVGGRMKLVEAGHCCRRYTRWCR